MAREMTVAKMQDPGKLELSNVCLYGLFRGASRIPVIKRLYPSLLKKWARLTWPEGYKVKRYRGLLFLLNYRNHIDRKIGLHGSYESDRCAYFFSEMEKGCDVFLDIGASVGIYALQAVQRGLAGEIHAFEPDPRNYAQLLFNISLNGFIGLVQTHPEALSSSSGLVQFEMANDGRAIASQVTATAGAKAVEGAMGHLTPGTGTVCQVMARPLDEMLSYHGKKVFIKIAVQGHELDVLKGAEKLLRDNNCFFEVYIWPENRDRVLQQFEAMGYKAVRVIRDSYFYLARKQ